MESIAGRLDLVLDGIRGGRVLGLYQYGSSAASGLRPSSDIDLMLVTAHPLSLDERRALLTVLLEHSGARATSTPGRPVELTSVVLDEVVPWRYPPQCDFLYGEWLRDEFSHGALPEAHPDPDLAILLTTLLQHHRVIRGPRPTEILQPVPERDLRRAMKDSLPGLLDNWAGDERNVLLTLARMIVTEETNEIVSKDDAARRVLASAPDDWRAVLGVALDDYLGQGDGDLAPLRDARHVADGLAALLFARL